MRRTHGGGKGRYVLQIVPAAAPEIMSDTAGPLILHMDWTLVTANKPARRGEALIAIAKGLGPTAPAVNAGEAFPSEPFAVVTSPIEMVVDGTPAPTINQIGLPGTTNIYQVAFRVPDKVGAGKVPIEIRVAWLKGAVVTIAVQ